MQLLALVKISTVHEALSQVQWTVEVEIVALVGLRVCCIVVSLLALVIIVVFQFLITFVSCMLLAMSATIFTLPILLWEHHFLTFIVSS